MDKLFGKFKGNTVSQEEHWISMSDLMAGLMMVFLLISIAFMQYVMVEKDNVDDLLEKIQIEKNKIKEVAVTYQNTQVALYDALYEEFKNDLKFWDAEIDPVTLEFRFNAPEVLFDTGKIDLKIQFRAILSNFFPRYLAVINNFRSNISEIRIEGHTSSIWNESTSQDESYFNNMELSQGRTRAVLQYVYLLPGVVKDKTWIKEKFAAVGFSSSHLILDAHGKENAERSRRVSFKILTNADTQIKKIIEN